MNKVMTSLKLSHEINQRMLHAIIEEGYGMRGKSRWIIEAVEDFFKLIDYPELVDIATEMQDLNTMISIRLPETLADDIENAIVEVRKKYPKMEGVKSNILRASIMQRLIRDAR